MTQKEYIRARIAKDRNYDGRFFFGVITTGIFCRPSCPSPVAKEENVRYFDSLYQALDQGFRPCYRCRPDVEVTCYNGNVEGQFLVKEALEKMEAGYLHEHTLAQLAESLHISDRHLRSLFVENLGTPPIAIARYQKALFAKKLLIYASQTITDVAYASGFGSIRQFNEVIKQTFGKTPTEIRENHGLSHGKGGPAPHNTRLLLPYTLPFDFPQILAFLRPRAVTGVEVVTETSYSRTFRLKNAQGFFTVTDCPDKKALALTIHCDELKCFMEIYQRVRRMFDLQTEFAAINAQLGEDPTLKLGMSCGQVPRLPVAFEPFEFMVRAILGQQITVKAATTLAERIARKANITTPDAYPEGLTHVFPNAQELQRMELSGLGITNTRINTLRHATEALMSNTFNLTANQPFETFQKNFSSVRGIGEWTVNYVAMRGLGIRDAFPATDLGVIKALTKGEKRPTKKEIQTMGDAWRPWRSYATLCLWASSKEM